MVAIKKHDVVLCECGKQAFAKMSSPYTVMVSSGDAWLLHEYWWTASEHPNVVYAQSGRIIGSRYLHLHVISPSDGMEADHADGNGLNCMEENLREATKSQNQRNQTARKRKKVSSRLKGVKRYSVKPIGRPYSARIHVDGKTVHLGSFATEEEAAAAYDSEAKKRFGDFARTNGL